MGRVDGRDPAGAARVALPIVAHAAARLHDALRQRDKDTPIVVVLSEFVPRHFWEYFLHNQSAARPQGRALLPPQHGGYGCHTISTASFAAVAGPP